MKKYLRNHKLREVWSKLLYDFNERIDGRIWDGLSEKLVRAEGDQKILWTLRNSLADEVEGREGRE